jgi:hypothetical protein
LLFINVQGCDNITMPPSIQEKGEEWSSGIWSFS